MNIVTSKKERPSFLDFSIVENKHHYWLASWYAQILGYKNLSTLKPNIEEAKRTCSLLNIDSESNFILFRNERKKDYKLTKFACFLIALHADGRKKMVKRARIFFLNALGDLKEILGDEDFLNRIIARDEIKRLNVILNKAARRARVKDFQFFTNEGYMGMYNNTLAELRKERQLESNDVMSDYMSMTELSANIFRVVLTTDRLKRMKNPSEIIAANAHRKIGRQIRHMIKSNLNRVPEQLPVANDLNKLIRKLKKAKMDLNDSVKKLKQD